MRWTTGVTPGATVQARWRSCRRRASWAKLMRCCSAGREMCVDRVHQADSCRSGRYVEAHLKKDLCEADRARIGRLASAIRTGQYPDAAEFGIKPRVVGNDSLVGRRMTERQPH